MIENFYLILMIVFIFIGGIITFITDFNYGKILNKHILILFKIGVSIQIIYSFFKGFEEGSIVFLLPYIVNLFIGSIIAVFLYHFEIWAAGDAKYIILMMLLFPVSIRNEIIAGNSVLTYIFIFSISFIYLVIESGYLFIREVPVFVKERQLNINVIKSFLLNWLFSFSTITIIYGIISAVSEEFLSKNIILIRIFMILFMFYFLQKAKNKAVYFFVIISALLIMIFNYFIKGSSTNIVFDYKMIAFIFVVIILRNLCARYNYKKVETKDVKAGMILSSGTFLGFVNSRVKGLPKFKSESIRSKINEEEAESIKRWQKSKYGQDYVYVLRQIPFAPFISIGTLGSIIFLLCR